MKASRLAPTSCCSCCLLCPVQSIVLPEVELLHVDELLQDRRQHSVRVKALRHASLPLRAGAAGEGGRCCAGAGSCDAFACTHPSPQPFQPGAPYCPLTATLLLVIAFLKSALNTISKKNRQCGYLRRAKRFACYCCRHLSSCCVVRCMSHFTVKASPTPPSAACPT